MWQVSGHIVAAASQRVLQRHDSDLQAEAAFVAFLGRSSRRIAICVRVVLLGAWVVRLGTWAMSLDRTPNLGGSIIIVTAIVTCLAQSESICLLADPSIVSLRSAAFHADSGNAIATCAVQVAQMMHMVRMAHMH